MSHLFKSKKQREREDRRDRRKAFRHAENALDDVKERIRNMDREASTQWEQAREAMKGGERDKARRLLQGYRASQILAAKMEQKRWVFEQTLLKMDNARTDQEFASALAAVNAVTRIDPEKVENVFEKAGELLGEQETSDAIWKKLHDKEVSRSTHDLDDQLPGLDELEKQIEDEASLETGGTPGAVDPSLEDRLNQTRQRLDKIQGD